TENLSYSEVSNYFFKASLYSIIKKPHLYIKNVFNSFINFWNPLLIKFNYTIKDFISQGLRILNFLIIIFFAFCIFLIKKIKFPAYLLFILFGILITSILQSLVEAGNHRFFLPTFPMLLILTSFLINNLLKQNLLQRVTYII